MECDICCRELSFDLGFHCVACARSTVYASRFESAKVLLAKEKLAARVEAIVSKVTIPGDFEKVATKDETAGLALLYSVETQKTYKHDAEERILNIREHTEVLRKELQLAKEDIITRKAQMAKRRADLDAVNERTPDQRNQRTSKITRAMKKGGKSFDVLHSQSIETRAFLCKEVALLLGLKQKRKRKANVIFEQYSLAGLPIADLKETYNMRCAELTASISNVAHLVVLASFYLSVRLPAEIVLPHRDYPLATISKPDDSYLPQKLPFPTTTPTPSWSHSPTASRHGDIKPTSRPRPLFIGLEENDDRVVHVARKDASAFNLFAEGVSLLAWDIAWLCRSQGMVTGTETWEGICDIGRNLYQLLLVPAPSEALTQPALIRDAALRPKPIKGESATSSLARVPTPRLGKTSHSSAHTFLAAPGAQDILSNWKFDKHTAIFDALKKSLVAEMNNAEWEFLREEEWDDGGEQFDEAVFIKTRAMDGHEFDDARSIMTTRTRAGEEEEEETGRFPAAEGDNCKAGKGTSGWTRVKSREN